MSDTATILRYEANKKSAGVAYILWFLFGGLGAHRFYLRKTGTATLILLMTLGSFVLMVVAVGFLTIMIPAIWVLIDAFLIPGLTREYNNRLASQLLR